jgi:LemA protein
MSAENPTPNSALASAGKPIAIILVIVVLLVFGGKAIAINNELVRLDESVTTQWAQVETVLQRRFDLIPNLVNTVRGYAAHEKEILERVTELRSQWGAAKSIADKAQAAGELEGVLSRLLIVAERYPDLKADQQFRDLQVQLEGTENRIAVERQRYNEAVQAYNTAVRQFPGSVVAGFRGFAPNDAYFKAAGGAEEAPTVDFSN